MGILEDRVAEMLKRRAAFLREKGTPLRAKVVKAAAEAKSPAFDPRSRPGRFGGERGTLTRRPAPGLVRPGVKVAPKPKRDEPRPAVEKISTAGPKAPPETLKRRIIPDAIPSEKTVAVEMLDDIADRLLRKLDYKLLDEPPFPLGQTQVPDVVQSVEDARWQWFYTQIEVDAFTFVTFITAPRNASRVFRYVRVTANNNAAQGALLRNTAVSDGDEIIETVGSFGLAFAFEWQVLIPAELSYMIGPGERLRIGNLTSTSRLFHMGCFYADIPAGRRPPVARGI